MDAFQDTDKLLALLNLTTFVGVLLVWKMQSLTYV